MMKNMMLMLTLLMFGLVGCVPLPQHWGVDQGNSHMARCHGQGHHHNARQDHTRKCLSDRDTPSKQ